MVAQRTPREYTEAAGATLQKWPSRASDRTPEIAGSLADQSPDRRLHVPIGLRFTHAGRRAVDRVPPEPLVVPGPDAARRARSRRLVIHGVVGQRQRVTAVSGRPDGLSEDHDVANHPGQRARGDRQRQQTTAHQSLPAVTRFGEKCGEDPSARLPRACLAGKARPAPGRDHPGPGPNHPRHGERGQGRGEQEGRGRLGHHRAGLPDQDRVARDHQGAAIVLRPATGPNLWPRPLSTIPCRPRGRGEERRCPRRSGHPESRSREQGGAGRVADDRPWDGPSRQNRHRPRATAPAADNCRDRQKPPDPRSITAARGRAPPAQ